MRSDPPPSLPCANGHQAGGDGGRGAPARPAGGAVGAPRVAGRRPHLRSRSRATAELAGTRLAQTDQAGVAHQAHHVGVDAGDEVGEGGRAEGGPHARGQGEVFDRGGYSGHRPERGSGLIIAAARGPRPGPRRRSR